MSHLFIPNETGSAWDRCLYCDSSDESAPCEGDWEAPELVEDDNDELPGEALPDEAPPETETEKAVRSYNRKALEAEAGQPSLF